MQRRIDYQNLAPAMNELSIFERAERRSPRCPDDLFDDGNGHKYTLRFDSIFSNDRKAKATEENSSSAGNLLGKVHRRELSYLSLESALTATSSDEEDGENEEPDDGSFCGLTEGVICRVTTSKIASRDELGGTAHSTFSSNALPLDVYLAGLVTQETTRRPVIVFDNAFVGVPANTTCDISGSAESSVSTTTTASTIKLPGVVGLSRWDSAPTTISDTPTTRRRTCPPAHPRWSTGDIRKDTGMHIPLRSKESSSERKERSCASSSSNSSLTWWYGLDEVDTDSAKFQIRKHSFTRIYQRQVGKPGVGRRRHIRRTKTIG